MIRPPGPPPEPPPRIPTDTTPVEEFEDKLDALAICFDEHEVELYLAWRDHAFAVARSNNRRVGDALAVLINARTAGIGLEQVKRVTSVTMLETLVKMRVERGK